MTRKLVAIGNSRRGDDAAGWVVGHLVTNWDVDFRTAGSIELISDWGPSDDVVIVDAMRSGASPGSVRRFDALSDWIPRGVFTSTHSFGPGTLIELAKATDHVPRSLVVYGIEVDHTDHEAPMSFEVARGVESIAKELQNA